MSIYTTGFRNGIVVASNVSFAKNTGLPPPDITTLGQILMGSGMGGVSPEIVPGVLFAGPGVTITPSLAPNRITISATGAVLQVPVQATTGPGVTPVVPTGAGSLAISGAAVANATLVPVQSRSIALNSLQIEVQRAGPSVATNTTQQGLASFNSAQFFVDINGWVSLAGGVAFDEINVQAVTAPGVSPVTPNGLGALTLSGADVPASAIPVQSRSVALNQLQIEVQRASAQAFSVATNAGLCSLSSAQFSVDGNGFVTNLNGLPASSFDVDFASGAGTDPVLPSALGVVNVIGFNPAAQAIPVRTHSTALNQYRVEVQTSSAQAVDTPTANGICHFNNTQFTVSATGFVQSLASVAFTWQDSAPVAMLNLNGYFATGAGAYTLPAGVADGDTVEIVDQVGGGVVVTAVGGNVIQMGNVLSSVNGTATSTLSGDGARFIFRLSAGRWISQPGSQGNWILA